MQSTCQPLHSECWRNTYGLAQWYDQWMSRVIDAVTPQWDDLFNASSQQGMTTEARTLVTLVYSALPSNRVGLASWWNTSANGKHQLQYRFRYWNVWGNNLLPWYQAFQQSMTITGVTDDQVDDKVSNSNWSNTDRDVGTYEHCHVRLVSIWEGFCQIWLLALP